MPSSIARRKVCQKAALLDRLRGLRLPDPSSPARPAAFPKVALCDDCLCSGFRMTAHRDGAACSGAVVRKPARNEPAGDAREKCSALSYGDYMTPKGGAKNRGGVWREQGGRG